ncbi:elicitor-responsive protein 3 [Beta vulgaris subsp. vulgaris]|uniref:elicitor-responsive protein 3 n=1 Tax=Beta vulgaris subsp. vulgaris TaxID=3555 RepID=UPI0020371CB2|nr:elicitor-responsive protein 3 [Beta vulgaris subsp. vulgaris]
MAQGTLEVVLINAKGLENTDFLNNMDPYVILSYGGRKQNSKVASGQGSEPEWNETFTFNVNSGGVDLTLKILDSDCGTEDDCVGEATIPLEPVFHEGRVPTTSYNVVKNQEFRGQIKLSLSFTHKAPSGGRETTQHGSYGGWRESSLD